MTVTQYIGARYVPTFADPAEWNSTRKYEPLTIVLHNGNSYTSRQAVPVGIDINNTDFWLETGNYNAQVEAYRQEVLRFDGRITTNADDIDQLGDDLQTETTNRDSADRLIIQRINTLDDTIEGMLPVGSNDISNGAVTSGKIADGAVTNSKIANGAVTSGKIADGAITPEKLAATIDPYDYFKGYNVVFIGDSYTYGTGASDHLDGDTKRFSSILATKLNATEYNFGVGSTGFCDPGSGGQNAPFKTQVNKAISQMSADERANTHLVVIAGGVNDFNEGARYSAADMQAGAHDAVTNAINGFTNAIVLLVPMLFKGHDADARLFHFENSLIGGIVNYAGTRRAVYIRGAWSWNFGQSSHYISDKLHPNDTGHMLIANMIYSHIFGGDAYANQLVTVSWETGFSSSTEYGGYFQFYNGFVCNQGLRVHTANAITAGTNTMVGSLSAGVGPIMNAGGVLFFNNVFKGMWQITGAGNIYITPSVDVPADTNMFLGPISYMPCGQY